MDGQNNTTFNDGDPVSKWNDLSGEENHAETSTDAKRPTILLSENNNGSVDFDGLDDKLVGKQDEYRTLVIVLKQDSTNSLRMVFGHSANKDDSLRYQSGRPNSGPDGNDWHYGATSKVYINGIYPDL